MDGDQAERLLAHMGETVKYAQAGEAVLAAVAALQPVTAQIGRVSEIDPELAPELQAALTLVSELGEALSRAAKFLSARYDASADRL